MFPITIYKKATHLVEREKNESIAKEAIAKKLKEMDKMDNRRRSDSPYSISSCSSTNSYKTKECIYNTRGNVSGFCKFGDSCKFKHSPSPVTVTEQKFEFTFYKTKKCDFFNTPDGCKFGDLCTFIHEKKMEEKINEPKNEPNKKTAEVETQTDFEIMVDEITNENNVTLKINVDTEIDGEFDEKQKDEIGNRIYWVIYAKYPELAGKITGMFLEMPHDELSKVEMDPTEFESRLVEAVTALEKAGLYHSDNESDSSVDIEYLEYLEAEIDIESDIEAVQTELNEEEKIAMQKAFDVMSNKMIELCGGSTVLSELDEKMLYVTPTEKFFLFQTSGTGTITIDGFTFPEVFIYNHYGFQTTLRKSLSNLCPHGYFFTNTSTISEESDIRNILTITAKKRYNM